MSEPEQQQQPLPTPWACPVCGGRGQVSALFYATGRTLAHVAAMDCWERCRSCQGAGICWSPLSKNAPPLGIEP